MPDVTKYLQRVSWLMRQGKPANDVAIYLPTDDAYAQFHAGQDSVDRSMEQILGTKTITQVLDAGYNFDFIDDGAIAKVGITYPVLILPNVERMPLATLKKIEAYASKGGIVIAAEPVPQLPSMAPGLQDAADTAEIVRIAKVLKVHRWDEIANLLPPDFATGDPAIGFNHRKIDTGDVYFVANTSNHPVHAMVSMRLNGVAGEWWDPFSGKVTGANTGDLSLDLAPYESRVLILSPESTAKPAARTAAAAALDISNGWTVSFNLNYTTSAKGSWADDPRTRFFSGTATYRKTVDIPAATKFLTVLDFGPGKPLPPTRMSNGMRARIDPPVREAAVVYVNGKTAGSVWRAPFEVEVGELLHAGANEIRIVVANTAINELAGQTLPDYKLLKLKYGDRFQPQDMNDLQPLPSGILGQIRLR